MKNLFHINSIYHTAAKNSKGLGSSEKGTDVNALKQEAIAMIEKLVKERKPVKSIQADPRFISIQKELESFAMDGSDNAINALVEIFDKLSSHNVSPTSEPEEDWITSTELSINTNSDPYKLLTRLNQVASEKISIVINDFRNFNTAPYVNCADPGTRNWALSYANTKARHQDEYYKALGDLEGRK